MPSPRKRSRKTRTPSLLVPVLLSLLTSLGGGALFLLWQINTPDTSLHNLARLLLVNRQVSVNNALLQQWMADLRWQDAAVGTFACLLVGGLTLGAAASPLVNKRRVLGTAAATSVGVLVTALLLTWYVQGNINGGTIDRRGLTADYLSREGGWMLLWTVAFIVGAWLGMMARRRRRGEDKKASNLA